MFPSISRSLGLITSSWTVLSKDKEILLFPILSAIACLLVVVSFIIPSVLIGMGLNQESDQSVIMYAGLFVFYLITYTIVIFFNVGLVTCANIRLNGGDPTFSDGITNAFRHLSQIITWALISATVGVLLSVLRDKNNALGQLVASLLGTAWSLLTYFVVPVMILENKGVVESITESASLFRKTWGETVVGQGGITLIFFLIGLVGVIPVILILMTGIIALQITVVALYLLLLVVLMVLGSALQGIFNTALYRYAKTGVISPGFEDEQIRGAFRPKGQI